MPTDPIFVIGAGPGIGSSVAHRFAQEGHPVGLVARNRERLEALGPAGILCVSPLPNVGLIKPVAVTSAEDLEEALDLGVVGTAAAVDETLPAMRERGRGTMLFTTGSAVLEPNPERAVSGIVNAAQATYFRMLSEALGPEGIHVSHTVIKGAVGQGKLHEPADIAEQMWQRHSRGDESLSVID